MKKTFLLTLSVAALLAFTAPVMAAAGVDAPVTEDTTQASETAPAAAPEAAATATPAPAAASAADDHAMTEGAAGAATLPDASADDDAEAADAASDVDTVAEVAHSEDAGHATIHYPQMDWSWSGPFGTFDRPALQRGFQVYKQVCAACHGLNRLSYRNLSALGYNEAEIKSIAAEASIIDGPNDEGEMFERPGRPSDRFKAPFANDNAARYANNGALPPDLSLIVRARGDGANYVHALLTGYRDAPAGVQVAEGMYYNEYFAGHQIAMAPPLIDGVLTYDDGTEASVEQMSQDLTAFLTWASEPVMELRKQTGLKVMLFLFVFSVLMYLTKRRVWKDIH